jgi:hypothetical protein
MNTFECSGRVMMRGTQASNNLFAGNGCGDRWLPESRRWLQRWPAAERELKAGG